MAAGFSGLAQGEAKGVLASLTGALRGWQEGDRERADRAFADWKAKSDTMLKDWEMRRQTYQDLMTKANLNVADALKAVELKAKQFGDDRMAEAARLGELDTVLGHVEKDRAFFGTMLQFTLTLNQQKELAELKAQLDAAQRGEKTLMRSDILAALAEAGWRPETPGYQAAYFNAAKQTPVEGLGVVGGAQLIVPPPPVGQPGAPPGVAPRQPPTPIVPATPKPGETTHYINKETLQPPPANWGLPQIQASGQYVAIAPTQLAKFAQMRTAGATLNSIEEVIRKRPDLWPEHEKDVVGARALFWALTSPLSPRAGTDKDIGVVQSSMVGIPSLVRSFGDVGNMSDKEQAIAREAAGFGASTRGVALARIENIRRMLNEGLEPTGVTFRFQSGAANLGGWSIKKKN